MTAAEHVVAVVLAAGASTRMGTAKQLLTVDGKSLLQIAVDAAACAMPEVCQSVVVLGANAEQIRDAVDFGQSKVLQNNDWQRGLSSSIVCAVKYIEQNLPQASGVILMLADQP